MADLACPLCARQETAELLAQNEHAVAFFDGFPVSPGHALIVPRRHVASLFDLTVGEQAAVWGLVGAVRAAIEARRPGGLAPHAYNVGANVGEAAGQTVAHAHVHLIPRYSGDVADPRGGVRWVVPQRAVYWKDGDGDGDGR